MFVRGEDMEPAYIAIDLKSFYASVECVERGLDPLQTHLVVADESRTEKTICLAVSPSLRAYGIPGRARLFEVIQKVRTINATRRCQAPHHTFTGSSYHIKELAESPSLALDYIVAPPRMAYYMKYSTRIYHVYLKYIAPEDIHVYSIDEVFIDATPYLATYGLSARELATRMIRDVLETTGITATVGIGPNLYLCKVAMDIVAKHSEPDAHGARMAELDELSYRQLLWTHRPLTDFWRIGKGYAKKLEENRLYTMGDIAKCSLGSAKSYYNEGLLYKLFGVNAELLIDHAWGWEPCTIADIKAYKPAANSLGSGQVLHHPYDFEKAKLIVREMTDLLVLSLVDKSLVTDQMVLTIGYDMENLIDPEIRQAYHGAVTMDHYGRKIPKHAHGTTNLGRRTASATWIIPKVLALYEKIVDKNLLIRRIAMAANHVIDAADAAKTPVYESVDLFADESHNRQQEEYSLEREQAIQKTILTIKKKFGKNAVLKGMNLEDGATTIQRNDQIGGHKA
jgi:DNA polymerase V